MEPKVPPACARRYAPRTVLASGGFGVVWVADQVELGRPVALKLLTGAAMESAEAVARFEAEARLTASFAHPHIVEVLDHDVEDGTPWIAYELLSGPSLRGRLGGGPIEWPEAVRIASQIAGALEHVHARGVLHRDIKPENVLQSAPGHWKVTDFGIAKWTGRDSVKTATGMVIGTPAYLAPEQIAGDPPSPASDVYALGILLHELIEGAPPFESDSPVVVLEMHLKSKPRPAARAPAAVQDVIATALAKRPEDRFGSMTAMRQALEACAGGEVSAPAAAARGPRSTGSTTVRVDAPVSVPARAAPAKGHLAVAAGVGALVALIAFAGGARRDRAPDPSATPATSPPSTSPAPSTSPPPASPARPATSPPASPSARAAARRSNVLGERDNAVAAYDPVRERVILFGGAREGAFGVGERDTWAWDGAEWSEVPVDRKSCPTFRFRHAMATDEKGRRVLLFGGSGPSGLLGDLWSWDGQRWTELDGTGGPSSRLGHVAVWDAARAELVVFGSTRADPRTWLWNERGWRSVEAGGPASRDATVAAYDEHRARVVVIGGIRPGTAYQTDDTWEWDGRAWTEVKVKPPGADATVGGRLAYDPRRRRVVLYGGPQAASLWEFDGAAWTRRVSATSPPGRYDHAVAYDRKRGVMVVYGGSPVTGDRRLGDTWEWDGAAWRRGR